ncbi:hypothetical protein CEXT_36171 [Caerostris extrusa]|uniref:Ribosomal protein L2 n=1 Tax=Caerostris extrusa TaxID=172846 RepID=A0AAV4MFJ9_CAEEX|nr:hypothetical protein CEXT_36171 [Caerostris extrusa]
MRLQQMVLMEREEFPHLDLHPLRTILFGRMGRRSASLWYEDQTGVKDTLHTLLGTSQPVLKDAAFGCLVFPIPKRGFVRGGRGANATVTIPPRKGTWSIPLDSYAPRGLNMARRGGGVEKFRRPKNWKDQGATGMAFKSPG